MSCPNCERIKAAARERANCCENGNSSGKSAKFSSWRERASLIISLAALVAGFSMAQSETYFPLFPLSDPSWIAVALCGIPIFKAAGKALFKSGKITSTLLISVAIFAAIALQLFFYFGGTGSESAHSHDSYIFAAGEIAFLMALGSTIEAWTVKKSRKGIEALVALTPKKAERKTANGSEIVPEEKLVRGDVIFVRPDDMIPADGIVVDGASSVNQASLTGESVPVDKSSGESVLAGTWNLSGALTVRVTSAPGETTIARLVKLVREAEEKKAPIQHIADKWASRIVPAAIFCAVAVALFARFVLGTDFIDALIRGVTILVVFCPCAFALATPTAIAAGIGNASRRGILVKSGDALEKLAATNAVFFDKTGTLTRAELKIRAVFSAGTFSENALLSLCAAAEKRSQHPIARAIVAEAAAKKISVSTARNISARAGIGIACDVDENEIFVCSFPALEKEKIGISDAAKNFAEERRSRGETLVCVVADGALEGIISLSDTLRDGVPAMIRELKSENIRAAMLSGDNFSAANHIAKTAGIDDVFSDLLPENKAGKIAEFRARGEKTLMVGDGVNDAPALAAADCSIAMGALGSELAVETADIAILNDNVALVPALIRFSKTVLKTIHINFGISLAINFASVMLSAAGVLDPVTGAIVHNASSIIVVSHSAVLMFRKIPKTF